MDSPFEILIIRDVNRSSRDDKIRIERVGGNIHITHEDGSNGSRQRVTTHTVLTHACLATYITALAAMIRDDTDPFHSVQFKFPGFPMVLYTPARLHNPEVMRTLKDAAHITADYWFREDPGYDAEEDGDSDASSTTSSSSSSSSSSNSTITIEPSTPIHTRHTPRHIFFD